MKLVIKKVLFATCILLFIVIVAVLILFWNEIGTLATLKQVDEHPLLTMTYKGDYGFSDFLEVGANSDNDIERFVVKRLLKGIEIDLGISSAGCSAFAAQNYHGQRIYARNFDFDYAPALLLNTTPSDGYASVSIVNLAFAGYGEGNLPKPYTFSSFLTLSAPYLPFDGMNEKGVVVALLAVPRAEPPNQEGKVMLNTTTLIRLILDHAASVEEAIALVEGYNLYFSGNVECHYLISDAEGNSAVIEFLENEVKITWPKKSYQAVTNFIMYQGLNEGEGYCEFERYDTIISKLETAHGIISETEAMQLLSDVAIPQKTQWSVVYNQATGQIWISTAEKYDQVNTFIIDITQ